MKRNIYLLRGVILALLLIATATACSQEAKKLRVQTSASAKETVQKPLKVAEKASVSQKEKAVQKPKAAKVKPAATKEQTKETKAKPTATKEKVKPAATKETTKAKAQKAKPSATKAKAKKHSADSPDTKVKAKAKQTSPRGKRRYIALKTNVPFLAVAVQNLAIEVQLAKHITLDLPVMWSISDIEREHALRTIALQPEARWWLKSAGTGHFFGLHAHVAWFNAKWDADRYQTEKRPLVGAGLSYGYKLPLSAHWGAEFNLGAGYANMKYNTYYNIENGAKIDTRNRHYWGITRAGISLVYRF